MAITVPMSEDLIYFDTLGCHYEPRTDDWSEFRVKAGPAYNVYVHIHNTLEFIYVDEGWMELIQPDAVYRANSGQLIAVAGFVPHGYRTENAMRRTMMLPPKCFRSASLALSGKMFRNPVIDDDGGRIGEIFGLMCDISAKSGCFSAIDDETQQQLLISTADTLVQIVSALSGVVEKSGSTVTVLRTMEYINEHFREDIRIPELARHLYCNQTTLAIQFKRVFGMTMNDYLNRVRAIEVRRMLHRDPTVSLADAAEQSGFGCLRTMSRACQKEFGVTPAAIVREITKNSR